MITVRKSDSRGNADHGWLHSRHTFSFANYHDPGQMGFRSLRVINEDKVAPGGGFGKHPHENMEILSYVVDGSLAHEDSAGHQQTIYSGWVQFMSAGTGVFHSEFNGSKEKHVHFLQIWVVPSETGLEPRYEDRDFGEELAAGELVLLLSPDGEKSSIRIGQDARIYAAKPSQRKTYSLELESGRGAWVQVIEGDVKVNGEALSTGDGAAVEGERKLELEASDRGAHFLVFDLA